MPTSSYRARETMQMNVVVTPPLTAGERGGISCRPMGVAPFAFDWSGPSVALDETWGEASDVACGRYRVRSMPDGRVLWLVGRGERASDL